MQANHRIRLFRRQGAHRDVFARFARTLEQILARPHAAPRPEPRVRRALR
ncbi:hypothetical protein C8N35_110140 [Breoghania corrubedonensis]|uniref:Uncharacterized protein n=1 Tax=Breoghania corrubedonensis TaxID=665038 RepID=A0A2T5V1L8_9HYPH|nr:hypothetical protein C8N35_110140 [Breoghania corrubedonensis]